MKNKITGENNMNNKKFYQQGDVVFRKVNDFPEGKRKSKNGNVIVEGEGSGHFHAVQPGQLPFSLFFVNDGFFLENESDDNIAIEHQEHNPIALPPGKYEIDRVNEFDWKRHFDEKEDERGKATRKVID